VHRSYSGLGPGGVDDLLEDRDPLDFFVEAGDREQNHLLELTEVFPSGHAFFHKCE
jgi:hypothetical protein